MTQYVGLDVADEETSVCVVDQEGAVLVEAKVASEPAAIAAFIRERAPQVAKVGFETGPLAAWHWHELKQLGLPVSCLDARHAKAALACQIDNTDRNDAFGLAQLVRMGWYREAQVESYAPGCASSQSETHYAAVGPRHHDATLGGIGGMADQWLFKSETYDNCNCAINCGCQFNLPSTNGYCQSAFIGHIVEGHFNDTPLMGLNWAALYKWPGEIKDGNGKRQIVIDERADDAQRIALETIVSGEACALLSNFFSVSRPPARIFARPCSCRLISRPTWKVGPQGLKYRAS